VSGSGTSRANHRTSPDNRRRQARYLTGARHVTGAVAITDRVTIAGRQAGGVARRITRGITGGQSSRRSEPRGSSLSTAAGAADANWRPERLDQ
jgi:hypothetical protein